MAEERWVTVNGVHVLIGEDGTPVNKDIQHATLKDNNDRELEELLGPKASTVKSIQDRIDWINAGDNHDPKNADRDNNCQRCVFAAEANARGYDTHAFPIPKNDEFQYTKNWTQAFKGTARSDVGGKTVEEVDDNITQNMNSYGKGSRAVVFYQKQKLIQDDTGGHVIMCENTDKGVVYYDPQSAKVFKNAKEAFTGYDHDIRPGERRAVKNAVTDLSSIYIMRTDKAKLDAKMLKKYKVLEGY